MNNNSSKQILLSVIGVAILVIAVVGVSFAFFSYVYNGGTANTVQTGTIVFSASDSQLKLTNVFPTDAYDSGIAHENDVLTATVSVSGNTTYEEGIDFTVRAMNVTNKSTGANPIVPTVLVTPIAVNGITYTTGTAGTAAEYNSTNVLASGDTICAGTIAANTVVGSVGNETQILEIKAFYDKADYHISDNTKEELVNANLLSNDYAGRIIPTDEWTALAGEGTSAAYSFKIQVTAVEGGSDDPRITQ